jgi:hypothetical protein
MWREGTGRVYGRTGRKKWIENGLEWENGNEIAGKG